MQKELQKLTLPTNLWNINHYTALIVSWTHRNTNKVHTGFIKQAIGNVHISTRLVRLPTRRKTPTTLCGYNVIVTLHRATAYYLWAFFTVTDIRGRALLPSSVACKLILHKSDRYKFMCSFSFLLQMFLINHCSITSHNHNVT